MSTPTSESTTDDHPLDATTSTETGQVRLVDITSVIQDCAACLSFSDPMLAQEGFCLQDSMAALELMDPKMDCCEIPIDLVAPPGVETPEHEHAMVFPRPPPRGLDDDVLPLVWDELRLRDAAFLGLQVLVRMDSLVAGASVLESTYTCLYAHPTVLADMRSRISQELAPTCGVDDDDTLTMGMKAVALENKPPTLAQSIVYAMTLALVEFTDIVRSAVLNADIYEEEDFSVNTYDIPVLEERDEVALMTILAETLQRTRQGIKEDEFEIERRVICFILGFQLDLITLTNSAAKLESDCVREVAQETQELARSTLGCVKELLLAVDNLERDETVDSVLRRSFDSYVNRPLVGNSPVRKVIFREPKESIERLRTLVSEFDTAFCDLMLLGNSLNRIRRILQRTSLQSMSILMRSLLVLNLYFDDKLLGQHSLLDLIRETMKQMSGAPEALFDSQYSDALVNRLAKPVYDTLKLFTLNRHRQRSYLEAVMLNEWSSLLQQAYAVDGSYRKEHGLDATTLPYFSHYVLNTIVELMDHHLSLGVELNLYHAPQELAVAYWYRDCLLSSLQTNLTSMRHSRLLAKKDTKNHRSEPKSNKKGKGKKNSNSSAKAVILTPEEREDEFEFLLLGLRRSLCRGLVRFFAALSQAKVLKEESYQFTSMERRFEKRFEAFAAIRQPPPMKYSDFQEGFDFSRVAQKDLLDSTLECFKTSKAAVDNLLGLVKDIKPELLPMQEDELRALAKVCFGNSIYLQKLKQIIQAGDTGDTDVTVDLDTHYRFCTIKLK